MDEATDQVRAQRRVSVVALVLVTVASATLAAVGTAVALDTFSDVPPGSTHEAGIEWLVGAGITSGCAEGRYCPNDAVTRAQMGTFMHRLSGNAEGVQPSVDALTLQGYTAEDLIGLGRPRAVAVVSGSGAFPNLDSGTYGFVDVGRFANITCVVPDDPDLRSAPMSVQAHGGSGSLHVMALTWQGGGCTFEGQQGIQVSFRDHNNVVAFPSAFTLVVH
jgi:hypothetical protein